MLGAEPGALLWALWPPPLETPFGKVSDCAVSRPSRLHMTGKPRVSHPPFSIFPKLLPGFTVLGPKGPWKRVSASLVLLLLSVCEGTLSTDGCHFEGQRSTQSLFPLGC